MQKKYTNYALEDMETKAQELIHMAFMFCEQKMKSCDETNSPEIKALAAAALSLEKAVLAYIAIKRISK